MTTPTDRLPRARINLLEERERVPEALRNEVDRIIDRYAHGDCHAFTYAVAERFEMDFVILRQVDGQVPVHSCLSVGGSPALYLDAYGLDTIEAIMERYSEYVSLYVDDDNDLDDLSFQFSPEDDELEDALQAFRTIIDVIGNLRSNTDKNSLDPHEHPDFELLVSFFTKKMDEDLDGDGAQDSAKRAAYFALLDPKKAVAIAREDLMSVN